jgi:hypothetical protein
MAYTWMSVPIADVIHDAVVVGDQLLANREMNGNETISVLSGMETNSRVFRWTTQEANLFDMRRFATSPTQTILVGMADSNWISTIPTRATSWNSEPSVRSMRDATYGKGLFVSVTAGSADRRPTIVYSEDGTSWTGAQCDGKSCEVPLQSVVFSDSLGLFLAVGDVLNHYTSVDGKNWTSLNIPDQYGGNTLIINRAVALPDGFVMVGTNGYVGVMRSARPTH